MARCLSSFCHARLFLHYTVHTPTHTRSITASLCLCPGTFFLSFLSFSILIVVLALEPSVCFLSAPGRVVLQYGGGDLYLRSPVCLPVRIRIDVLRRIFCGESCYDAYILASIRAPEIYVSYNPTAELSASRPVAQSSPAAAATHGSKACCHCYSSSFDA